jgi:hypothetical protein
MAFNFITNPLLRFLNKRSFPTKNLGKMNRDFLKEAIADAKAVKESAIANAKVALEEAFSPQVQAMFASKLEEMEKEDVDEAYDEVDEAKDDAEKMEEKMSNPVMRKGLKGDNEAERETEKMRFKEEKEDMDEDMDLDEILAELEKDEVKEDARTDAEQEGYKDGFEDAKDDIEAELKKMKVSEEEINEDERTDAEEEGYLDGMKDEKEDMEDKDDEDIDLEDMSEDDLKKFIEDVIEDMVNAGEIEAGESFEDDVDVDVDADGEIEVEDDEMTSVDVAEAKEDMDEGKEEMDEAKDEMDEMKKDLDEAMATIETLRSELNEINLLNAKLLYTNKVFRGKNLTEAQKVKVLGAFDKAETVKEVKLVFETLSSAVKAKAVNKSITEAKTKGSASNMKATPTATKKQPIVESDEMVSRFKKLAGII